MKKHISAIIILFIIIGVIALGIWYSDKNSPIKQLAKLDIYSKEELSFLEKQGFLDDIDSENLPSNKEQIISLFKSPDLIEQDINTADESFKVLATKLDKNTYQLAFKLENKSNENKEFYLIPVSDESQLQFKEIRGRISGTITEAHNTPLTELYDVNRHKSELKPELAQAYNDIEHNNYQAKPIKITLAPNSSLLAKSKWEINRDRVSGSLKPVYFLVHGSAGGVKAKFIEGRKYIISERNFDRVQFEELRKKIDWKYNLAHDALSQAYYEGQEFIWKGYNYGVLDKVTFDKLQAMIWARYKIMFHQENLKQTNPYPESEYNEICVKYVGTGENRICKTKAKENEKALERIQEYQLEGLDIDL